MPIIDEVLLYCEPGELDTLSNKHIVLMDGTDIPTRKFRAGITENYSGKKHRHGLLIQVVSNDQGRLLNVSKPVPGRRHDNGALREVSWEEIFKEHIWLADPSMLAPMRSPR